MSMIRASHPDLTGSDKLVPRGFFATPARNKKPGRCRERDGLPAHEGGYQPMGQYAASHYRYLVVITFIKITLVCFLHYRGHHVIFIGQNAQDHYLPIAERLILKGQFNGPATRPDSKVPPGYPIVVAAVRMVAAPLGLNDLLGVCCVQILADLAVSVLLCRLGLAVGCAGAGRLAALGWQFFPPAIAISCWITAENLFTLFVLLSVLLLTQSIRSPRSARAWIAGLALGLATLFRPTCLWLPLFVLPLFWFFRHEPKLRAKAIAYVVGTWCVVLPWTVRNAIVLGDPILVAVGSGSVFLQGSDERVFTIAGKTEWYPKMFKDADNHGVSKPVDERESKIDGWLFAVGLFNYRNRMETAPFSFLSFFLKKILRLWYATESGGLSQQLVLGAASFAIAPLGLLGVWNWVGEDPVIGYLFGAIIAYFVLVHVVTLPMYRYIHPVLPLIMLAASHSMLRLRCRWTTGLSQH
jgi:4-amino-4-deoxy-L-arabinose transferase-like glycosyltransferase